MAKTMANVLFERPAESGVETVFRIPGDGIDAREKPQEIGPAVAAVFASTKPAIVDLFEPPMPAQAKVSQGNQLVEGLARGEPNRGKIATTIFRDKLIKYSSRSTRIGPREPDPVSFTNWPARVPRFPTADLPG